MRSQHQKRPETMNYRYALSRLSYFPQRGFEMP